MDSKLFEELKEAMTITSESGCSRIKPEYDDVYVVHDLIYNFYKIKELQHQKDTTIGLYATDKEPNKLFELAMDDIDGNPILSAIDYEYFKKIFDKKMNDLMFRIT